MKARGIFLAIFMILALSAFPMTAAANAFTRTNSFAGSNITINIRSLRPDRTGAMCGEAWARTRNANSHGMRARVVISQANGNHNRTSIWQTTQVVGSANGRLANGVTGDRIRIVANNGLRSGRVDGEGQRRATSTGDWAAGGTIRTRVTW